MSDRKRLIEHGKTALIVLLIISAVLLVRQSGYYTTIPAVFAPNVSQRPGSETSDAASSQPARPMRVVVSSEENVRYASEYDQSAVSSVYGSFSAAFGEALGSASEPTETTEADFRRCLTGVGVTLDFYYPKQLGILAVQLGTASGAAGEHFARFVSLECSGENAVLYFLDSTSGVYYRCSTGVVSSTILSKMDAYRQNNAVFAFENEKYSAIFPYTVILETLPEIYALTASGYSEAAFPLDELFSLLGMNTYVMRQYAESDGTIVYVESGKTLRIRSDGSISFKQPSASAQQQDVSELISQATQLLSRTLGVFAGSAEINLSGVTVSSPERLSLSYDYCVDGIPVRLDGGAHAASVAVSGGTITKLELHPRRYTLTADTLPVLPMEQACAIASAQGGGEPMLSYADRGSSTDCIWVIG